DTARSPHRAALLRSPVAVGYNLECHKNPGGACAMKVSCVCGIGLSFAIALNSAAGAAPDISGTYWATSYSPTIPVLGGGDPPLNAAGKAAYEMTRAGLKDGSIVDKARRVCVPDGVPRVLATPYPFEIFQAPAGQVTFLYEMNHQVRVIVMDKPLPPPQTLIV